MYLLSHFFQALKRKILLKGKKIENESESLTDEVSDEDEAAEMNKDCPASESPPTAKVTYWETEKKLSYCFPLPCLTLFLIACFFPYVEIEAKTMQRALRPDVL